MSLLHELNSLKFFSELVEKSFSLYYDLLRNYEYHFSGGKKWGEFLHLII